MASVIHQTAIHNVAPSTILASKLSSSGKIVGKNRTAKNKAGPRMSPTFLVCFIVIFIRYLQTKVCTLKVNWNIVEFSSEVAPLDSC
jgi:hypothetical protein